MMDYLASITYRNPVPERPSDLVVDASREHRLLGFRCPVCEQDLRRRPGLCPIDALELGTEHLVDLPTTGTITNFVVVTPVQYPGQTETEPFARVFVLLDGTDVIAQLPAGGGAARPRRGGRRSGERRVGVTGRGGRRGRRDGR